MLMKTCITGIAFFSDRSTGYGGAQHQLARRPRMSVVLVTRETGALAVDGTGVHVVSDHQSRRRR